MARNAGKPNNPFFQLTAEERAKISLPDRFKCRQCDQFKIPASFSNKEIKDYQFKKTCIPGINGVTAKLRCRPCAGEQLHELQCEGPCGFKKPLDCFSKSQRTRGLKWCQECVLWKEGAEPGTTPTAAPGTDLAPDEAYHGASWGYDSDPEIGSDSDDESEFPSFPYRGIENLKISGKANEKTDSAVGARGSASMAPSAAQSMPRLQNRPVGASGRAPSGTVTASQSGYVPPHIRALGRESSAPTPQPDPAAENLIDIDADAKTVSSASNPYEDAWSSIGTLGPWSAVDTRRRNALYEPHRSIEERVPSVPGADSVPSRPSGRHSWARPAGARKPPPQFPQPAAAPTHRRQRAYDSDGSPDEM